MRHDDRPANLYDTPDTRLHFTGRRTSHETSPALPNRPMSAMYVARSLESRCPTATSHRRLPRRRAQESRDSVSSSPSCSAPDSARRSRSRNNADDNAKRRPAANDTRRWQGSDERKYEHRKTRGWARAHESITTTQTNIDVRSLATL